ncbi:MAG TPA: GGDEF domain-containing protein [Negativicutes bacterium]|nr:GGDEF domain-containing protein [Negativicutes bacterium]
MKRLSRKLTGLMLSKQPPSFSTVSIGVATWTDERDLDASGLIEIADKALYGAKQLGRNRVCGETHCLE